MNKTQRLISGIGIGLCGALFWALPGSEASAQVRVGVGASVSVGTPTVQIHAVADFEEPLRPYGRWEVVGSFGRCWVPTGVEADWSPYCNGYWEQTDAGWYWVSEEPWAWATYHYGRWEFSTGIGWCWVPQTEWAPAWVTWREGGGYVGWAPLGLSVSIGIGSAPRGCVFVEERHFLEPVRRTTVITNNTTIINKTVNISNTTVVNNTVINQGPKREVIAKATGKTIQPVAVREVRSREEAKIASKPRNNTPSSTATRGQTPAPTPEPDRRAKRATPAPAPSPAEKVAPNTKERQTPNANRAVREPASQRDTAAKAPQTEKSQPSRNYNKKPMPSEKAKPAAPPQEKAKPAAPQQNEKRGGKQAQPPAKEKPQQGEKNKEEKPKGEELQAPK